MPRVLIAEDEAAIADAVLYALRSEGIEADHCLLAREVAPRVRAGGVDEHFARLMSLEWRDGSEAVLAGLGSDGAALDEEWADEHGIGVGDRFAVVTPTGKTARYVARGTFDNPGLTGDFLVSTQTLAAGR